MFIAISQRLARTPHYDEVRECLALEWGGMFSKNGTFNRIFNVNFLPLPLSYEIPFSAYLEQLDSKIKAVILSGGNDLSIFSDDALSFMRDKYESSVIESCIKLKIPLLGICRGAQILAHFFGSKITKVSGSINHTKPHSVEMLGFNGRLDSKKFLVNSFHNFYITHLGQDLLPLAIADDKSVESFKHKSLPIYAMMWHIERDLGLENVEILGKWMGEILKK